jgi:putative copper export protein
MDIGTLAIHFVHIAAGAAWFGGSLFANVVLLPFILRQPPQRQRELVGALIIGPERVMIGAALGTAVTGLLQGTFHGRIESVAALSSPYGEAWLGAVLVALVVFAIGGGVTSPAARALRDDDEIWADARGPAAPRAAFARLRLGFRLELAGIAGIVGLMALMPTL